MSHGGSADDTIEPNLTPLLDLVLQLLMFFMITVNFTQGVTNTGETLPRSETAAPLDPDGNDPLILSVKPFRMGNGVWKVTDLTMVALKQAGISAVTLDEVAKLRGREFPDSSELTLALDELRSAATTADQAKGELASQQKRILDASRPRDDFKYLSKKEREKLSEHFKEGETCVFIPTESLTEYEKEKKGYTKANLVRNMEEIAERLKKLGDDEKDLAKRERERGRVVKARVNDTDEILVPVHIRADADVKTGDIYELMDACKAAGFPNIRARALLGFGEKKK